MDFKHLAWEDFSAIEHYLPRLGTGDCNLSKGALWVRRAQKQIAWASHNECLILSWRTGASTYPLYSCFKETPLLKEDLDPLWSEEGQLCLYGDTETLTDEVQGLYPKAKVDVLSPDTHWDYLYEREAFVTLAGSRLHGKRNFVKRFYKMHPNAQISPIGAFDRAALNRFLNDWYENRELTEDLILEKPMIQEGLNMLDELGLIGVVLHEDNQIFGLSFGAPCSSDTFAVHIEKAERDVVGAYPALAQGLAKVVPEQYRFLNREEDLGVAGLKKAKEDWKFIKRLKKGHVNYSPLKKRASD